jgi:ABC-type dipeptide/oligopeptide/nickel transport system ATPase component
MPKNDIRIVRPVKIKGSGEESKPLLGSELIDQKYCNLFLCAITASGKSTVINHICRNTIDKRTKVFIISSTIHIDPIYIELQKWFDRKGISYTTFTSMFQDKVNVLDSIMKTLEKSEEEKDDNRVKEKNHRNSFMLTNDDIKEPANSENVQHKPKYKYDVPEFILIMDDLSRYELRHQSVSDALKKARHHHLRIIISSQHLIHLSPDAFSQLYLLYIWKGFSEDYIKKLHNRISTSLSTEQFIEVYRVLTEHTYQFMNLNLRKNIIRQSFGPQLDVELIYSSIE